VRGRSLGLGLIAAAAALPIACDDGGPVQRGFGSHQLVAVRDPTFTFVAMKGDLVYYATGDSVPSGTFLSHYWSVDIVTGEIKDLGPDKPDLNPQPPTRYQCSYGLNAEGLADVFMIADTQTQQLTVIDNVVMTSPYCPADDDPRMLIWRREPDSTRTLWMGPYDALEQVPLSVTVHQTLWHEDGTSLVSALPSTADYGLAVFAIADQDPTVATEIVPAALAADAAWATGAPTASAALDSSSLVEPTFFWAAGGGLYNYGRAMKDGSRVLVLGPYDTGPREMALFPFVREDALALLRIEPYNFRYDGRWPLTTAWMTVDTALQSRFRVWREGIGRFASCPWPDNTYPIAVGDPADENVLFLKPQNAAVVDENSPLLVMVPSLDGDAACKVVSTTAVGWADFSPDGTATSWLEEPPDVKSTLWTAGRDGSAPRAIGTGLVYSPRFVGDSQLEFINDGDLVWVDVHDQQARSHFVTEQVFGTAIDLGRWVVTGHEYSDQDSNGQLALVNRDSGETHEISPAVTMYTTPDVLQRGTTIGVFNDSGGPVRIIYLVRGRNPSSQDGIWVATITAQDRQ
jgi:hypothetical protein